MLARIKAASEGDLAPLRPQMMSRLGAPFGANWSAYPSSDLLFLWTLGQLARLTGVEVAANLALVAAVVSAALAFYASARWLRVRWEWAMAGALLFAFTYQSFNRGLPHLLLAFSWTVPLAVLSCAWVASSRRLRWGGGGGAVCLGTGLVLGVSNPYALFLFLQLMSWALVVQWLGRRRPENLRIGLATLAVAVGAFFVVEAHVWLFATDTAADSPLERNYGGTERYALKPLELVVPPAQHRWEALAFFGQRYLRWSDWRSGEVFAPYLGLAGIAGLIWIASAAFAAVLRRRRVPGGALTVVWVLAFASIGGLTNVIALISGVTLFRASNRFSIFLSAVVLLFLVSRLSRWWGRHAVGWSIAAAALVAAVGVVDQVPRAAPPEKRARVAAMVASDRELGRRLEAALPAGAMVFQLPVVTFPEPPPQFQLGDYEHFRPFLGTRTLRFTYGSLKGRSRGQWQRDVVQLPTDVLVRDLERQGFSAIYLNRRGFADHGERILRELAACGRAERIEGARREQIAVRLKPSLQPEFPVARRLTFGWGWHRAEPGEPRWAFGPAAMSFFNPHAQPREFLITLRMSGAGPRRTVILKINDREQLRERLGESPVDFQLRVTLPPGFSRFDFESPEPAVRLSEERRQLRVLAVHRADLALVAAEGPGR